MSASRSASGLLVAGLIHSSQADEFGYTRSLVELAHWVRLVASSAVLEA